MAKAWVMPPNMQPTGGPWVVFSATFMLIGREVQPDGYAQLATSVTIGTEDGPGSVRERLIDDVIWQSAQVGVPLRRSDVYQMGYQ